MLTELPDISFTGSKVAVLGLEVAIIVSEVSVLDAACDAGLQSSCSGQLDAEHCQVYPKGSFWGQHGCHQAL